MKGKRRPKRGDRKVERLQVEFDLESIKEIKKRKKRSKRKGGLMLTKTLQIKTERNGRSF